jgi:hypothetical protein
MASKPKPFKITGSEPPVPYTRFKVFLLRYNELYSMWHEQDLKDFFRIRPLDSY